MIGLRKLDVMVGSSALGAIALAWLLVVGVDVVMSLARELDEIDASYTLGTALSHVLWTVPRRAYEWFTTAAVIGSLVGVGALAPTAEITAMRAAGLSKWRIALGALAAVGLLTAAVMAMGETLAPWGERHAQAIAAGAKSRDLIAAGRSGIWAREGGVLLNARRGQVVADGVELHDVRLYAFAPDGQLASITRAARAVHQGAGWRLVAAARTDFGPEAASAVELGDIDWPAELDPRLLTLSIVRPQNLGIADLHATLTYLERNELDSSEIEAVLWERAYFPLNVLVLVAAVLPFSFGLARSGGLGLRLLLGIGFAIAWHLGHKSLQNLAGVYGIDFRLAQSVPLALLVLVAVAHFRRAR